MMREELLDNVFLTYVPSRKFKTALLSAQIVSPLSRETAGRNALLVNVLSRGTVDYPDLTALNARLDQLYGAQIEPTVRKMGENQVFGFQATCVEERFLPQPERLLEPLADLLGEFFCHPATRNGRLVGDYILRERENLSDLIRGEVGDKRGYALRRLMEEMCRQEPYGVHRLGEAEQVERISLQRLNGHYKTLLPQARLELFYCGGAERERVAGMLRRAFAALPRQGAVEPAVTARRSAPETPRLVEETMDVLQGQLCLGFRLTGEDPAAAMVMNAMYGGCDGSKLFMNVRERLSLCYDAASAYHREKGILTVSAGIDAGDYRRTLDEILAQLEAMGRGEWTDQELTDAKSALQSHLRCLEDSPESLEDFAMGRAASGSDETVPGLMAALEAVTPQAVQEAARAVQLDTIYFLRGEDTP